MPTVSIITAVLDGADDYLHETYQSLTAAHAVNIVNIVQNIR